MAEWADLVLVYPASATTLSRIATGDCSDIVSAIAITTRAPVVVAPSMNGAMWTSSAVRRNVEVLLGDGLHVIAPGLGIEVADRPDQRTDALGTALAPDRIADIVPLVIERYGKPAACRIDWEAAYGAGSDRPWEPADLDGELLAALKEMPPPRSLLDAGTGSGTIAIAAARLGYRVVATDVSEAALAIARSREGAEGVVFLREDVASSHLRATFDVVVDRGCLHARDLSDLAGYARSLGNLVARGGRLLVIHDQVDAPGARPTLRIAPDALAAELDGFSFVRAEKTTLVAAEPHAAWLTILERSG
jgi:SAM-dependent methyltransferase